MPKPSQPQLREGKDRPLKDIRRFANVRTSFSYHPQPLRVRGRYLSGVGHATTQELQSGTYQQIRLILADNSASVSNNLCGNSTNCVQLSSDGSVHQLLLSSESKTGLKIPSGQIAAGGFTIAPGQTKDLDIDFNTCASTVNRGQRPISVETSASCR
jgi:hypothetical protein